MYRHVVKPIFFRMDPETAHHITIGGLHAAETIPGALSILKGMYGMDKHEELETNLWNIHFPNPIGLAAGLDKNGKAVKAFSSIGFGFVEVGTVTPKAQPGNEQPRLFRLPPDEALINRMGFNNEGADQLAARLGKLRKRSVPVAINIGKNKVTPNEEAIGDYLACIRKLYPYGDLFVVNISSPNTPDLRKLQHGEELKRLLDAVTEEIDKQNQASSRTMPVLIKIAPDLEQGELEQIVETIASSRVSGVIATNTTLSRSGLSHPNSAQTGGLSGKPLKSRATEVIRSIYKWTGGKLPIVGSGGIFTAEDAYEKIRAGASLVEIYTALIYNGPGINRELAEGLIRLLRRDGYTHISQAVGADALSS